MGIVERNASWKGQVRQFVQTNSRSSAPRIWTVWVEDSVLQYVWGQINGAQQSASETAPVVNAGKKNEVSAPANALALALRKIELKSREGYREVAISKGVIRYLDELPPSVIDFSRPLPQNLAFYKPLNAAGTSLMKKLEKGLAWYIRKYNGLMYVIVADDKGNIQMYSRRMLLHHDNEDASCTWNMRFPKIVEAAKKLMPPKSILLGELIVEDPNETESFKNVQKITKSLTAQSLADQAELLKQGYAAKFIIWDVAFWEGEDLVSKRTVQERYNLMNDFDYQGISQDINPAMYFIKDEGDFAHPDAALKYAKKMLYEGFVVVDPQGIYGDKAFNFKGKPDRPGSFCAKLKPSFEDDFVVLWDPNKGYGELSTKGRYDSGIKCVALFQLNSRGEMNYISNLSSGMTEAMKRDWANPRLYPQVWKVEYKDRTYIADGDDTNALMFASFIEVRTDKKVAECINPQLG